MKNIREPGDRFKAVRIKFGSGRFSFSLPPAACPGVHRDSGEDAAIEPIPGVARLADFDVARAGRIHLPALVAIAPSNPAHLLAARRAIAGLDVRRALL